MKSRLSSKVTVLGILLIFIGAGAIPTTIGFNKQKEDFNVTNPIGYIQGLINNASVGETVIVPSGTYYENILINKTINLVGEDKDTTIIMPNTIHWDVVLLTADWVNFSGFTVRKGGEDRNAIEINSDHNSIKGNNISNNYGAGIGIFGLHNDITDNEIFSNDGYGLDIKDCSYNTVKENTITYNFIGIHFDGSENNIIDDNIILNNENGITIEDASESNSIIGNYISKNECGINLDSSGNIITGNSFLNDGLFIYDIFYNTFEDNTVNGKPLVFLMDESNKIIDVDAGQIILINCDDITIQDQEITNTHNGITLLYTDHCLISNNDINSNNKNGIDLYYSNNNTISDNTINSNIEYGINIGRSSYNNIEKNLIQNNEFGINIINSNFNNAVTDNTINSNSEFGLLLSNSNNNIITGNTLEFNIGGGIWLKISDFNTITCNNLSENTVGFRNLDHASYENLIYHNNFIKNDENAQDNSDKGNTWDDGKYGNFWSDYKQKYPNAKKILKEGIWDTPYEVPGRENIDTRPLIKQWPKSSSVKIKGLDRPGLQFLIWLIEQLPMIEKLLYLLN